MGWLDWLFGRKADRGSSRSASSAEVVDAEIVPVETVRNDAPTFDVGEPLEDSDWRVGDRALGRWFDFYWYPSTLLAVGNKGYHLLFDDGDQRVVTDRGIMPLDVEVGESIQIRPKIPSQTMFAPARVLRAEGEMLDVEFEDGSVETNIKLSRGRLWRCPVGVAPPALPEGTRVLAQDVDGFTYPAEILTIDGDRIMVHFLDGPERILTPELLRPFELTVGQPVECRWKGGQVYFSGRITALDGERVRIDYDDGDQEQTTIRLLRLK